MDANFGSSTGGFVSNAPLVRTPGWRTKAHTLLHRPSETAMGRNLRISTFVVIILSTVCFILQSIPDLATWSGFWKAIDMIVALLFTVEYIIKLIVVPDGRGDEEHDHTNSRRPPPASPCKARLRFAAEPMSIVDLVAIVPVWVELILPFLGLWFLQILRSLRLMRILRTLRLAQESTELRILVRCVSHGLPALRMLCFFLVLDLVIVGGLVFHAERGNGPNEVVNSTSGLMWVRADAKPAVFQSIPDAMWWALVTVTTVGYGEEVPATLLGKLVACAAMLTGLIGISSIISIISAETTALRATRGSVMENGPPAHSYPLASPTASLLAGDQMALTPAGGLRPLSLPAMSASTTRVGGGDGELDERIRSLQHELAARQRTCADASKRACLAALEESALSTLQAFRQLADDDAPKSRPIVMSAPSGMAVAEVAAQSGGGEGASC